MPKHGVLRHGVRGFTYLGVLLAVAMLGIGLTAASEVWVTTSRREKMEELDWIGAQFVQAIASYREASPGSVKVFPRELQHLLEDHRYLTNRHHLRKMYLNPFTGKADWALIFDAEGGVRGIRATLVGDSGSEVREFVFRPELNSLR